MSYFTLDADCQISVHNSAPVADSSECAFGSLARLNEIAADWPTTRLVEIWNQLPGVPKVRKFTDRKTAIARIWKFLQEPSGLAEEVIHLSYEPDGDGKVVPTDTCPLETSALQATTEACVALPAANVIPVEEAGSPLVTGIKQTRHIAMKADVSRKANKTETVLLLLKRDRGVTLAEIMTATGWQAHSVRGFLSGTVGKKMGLLVASGKGADGVRSYSTNTTLVNPAVLRTIAKERDAHFGMYASTVEPGEICLGDPVLLESSGLR